jgi:UDP-N-acetylmuramate dehydrogenase
MIDQNSLPVVRGTYRFDYDLAPLTWFKVGGKAEIFFKPKDAEDLAHFLQKIDGKFPLYVLGAGSNIIIRDGGIEGVVIKLGGESFANIVPLDGDRLFVGAGCLNYNLAQYAKVNGLSGAEFLVGIPGTIGGGVAMNAGAYGSEFKDIITEIHALDMQGNAHVLSPNDMGFVYRGNSLPEQLIFTAAKMQLSRSLPEEIAAKMAHISKTRATTQPITEKTSGSSFANPEGPMKAWQMIDAVAMRGARINDAMISDKHCNFMINTGCATAADLEALGELVREKVWEKFQVKLKWEIQIIGKYE